MNTTRGIVWPLRQRMPKQDRPEGGEPSGPTKRWTWRPRPGSGEMPFLGTTIQHDEAVELVMDCLSTL